MSQPLRVLVIEDSEDDALLLVRELQHGGYAPSFQRVDTPEAMTMALDSQTWDIIIADYVMPHFSAPAALKLLKEKGLDTPFIIVSGAIGEETAVSAMKAGAHDYVVKGKLARLVPAIERELREAHERQQHQRAQKALLESETRYRSLFENASDALLVHDMEGNIIMANRAIAKLTGYTIDELLNMNTSQLPGASKFKDTMEEWKIQAGNASGLISQVRELRITRKDGAERTVELVTSLLTHEGQPTAIQAMLRDITEERRTQEDMRTYGKLVTEAQEEERKRIARDLHDETAQELSRLGLDIDFLISAGTKKGLPAEIVNQLERLRDETDHILRGVRRFGHDLRPPILEDFGLLMALQWLTDDLASQGVLSSSVEVLGTPRRLSPHTELVLFRIAQEALNNVRKHSQATRTVVSLEFGSGRVVLRVADNGHGFEVPQTAGDFARLGKLGILGMHERASLISGSCSIQSEKGKGTTVTVEVAE